MARIAFALPTHLERVLVEESLQHGHEVVAVCASGDELASHLAKTSCEFAVVSSAARFLSGRVLAEADRTGTRIVAINDTDVGRRHAITLGLLEVVDGHADWAIIEGTLLATPLRSAAPVAQEPSSGRVIAVWGPAGAPGRTSLAINIAAEIASAGHSVALADADTHSGSIAPSLGLLDEAPGFAAACRLAGVGALSRSELERIAQRYSSGHGSFWALTGIGRPSRWPELTGERVAGALDGCRDWVEYTVVDTGFSLEDDDELSSDIGVPRRNAATLQALRSADTVVAVASADPVGLARFLRTHADLMETVTTDHVVVAVNRVRASVVGSSPGEQVARSLERFGGIVGPVMIPHDLGSFDQSILRGATLADVAPRSAARAAFTTLVRERLLPPSSAPERRRSDRFTRGRRAAVASR